MPMQTDGKLGDLFKRHMDENRGADWTSIWNSCSSTVYLVLDEQGFNVRAAKVRHFAGRYWLSVDDVDGYKVSDDVDWLNVKKEE